MCQECGFYKGRVVIDMKAKTDARTDRMTAKKEAIKGQQTAAAEEGDVSTIPDESSSIPPEQVAAGKSEIHAAPEMAKTKSSTPRKEQGS
jgi:hypothetical protein